MPGPWEKYGAPAAPASTGGVFNLNDPDEDERLRLAREAAARAAAAAAQSSAASGRSAAEWNATHNPDGTPKQTVPNGYRPSADGNLEAIPGGPADISRKPAQALRQGDSDKLRAAINQYSDMARVRDSFIPDFGGNPIGGIENMAQGLVSGIGTPGQRDWWSDLSAMDNLIRNDLFGASLTAGEKQAYQRTTISPSMDPKEINRNLQRREEVMRGALSRYVNGLKAGGWSEPEIDALLGEMSGRVFPGQKPGQGENRQDPMAASGAMGGAGAPPPPAAPPGIAGGSAPTPPPLSPGDPRYQAATGGNRAVNDPETASAMDKLVRSGASLEQLNAFGRSKGMMPVNPQEYEAVRDYLRKNPGYQGGLVNAQKYEPLSMFEQGVTAIGDNAAGAYALGAGQFLSGNTLDNMASDPERARLAMGISKAQSPTATTLGEVSGGVMAGLTGEAAMARAGMAPGIARGVLADAIAGGANGAGAADNGDRLLGAAKGAAVSGAGSYAGTLASKGIARALAATGGKQAPLYAAGVTPTLGQRVADKGVIGRAINMGEEALQSVPVVGSAIRGARQEARDQFQVGAFNEALKEVGEQLPKGMKPGTDPHAYAQKVFNRAYDEARGGMKLLADKDLKGEIGGLAPDISVLGPQARAQLKSIVNNNIDNRMVGGQMGGETYKRTHSDLGKHIARLSKSSMAEDQQLASVLTGVRDALDNAARRHSDPEAVSLLDAADAGYAKLVRIEGAAARRGGDDGTFSPAQFSSEVQKASGGVRSKGYLRGDALMQAYAKAGKTLEDKLSNSGTVDRGIIGLAATGGLGAGTAFGAVSPLALTGLAGVGAAYAPGARKIMQGALKPAGESRKAIAERLRKRARLIGAGSGSTVGSLLLGTTPSQ